MEVNKQFNTPLNISETSESNATPPTYEQSLYGNETIPSQPPQYTTTMMQESYQHNPKLDTDVSPVYNPAQYSHIHQHHYYQLMQNILPGPAMPAPSNLPKLPEPKINVITLAKGAKIRTLQNGSISIPPPPPGCVPTPGQLAVMQGKPVIVKKQKMSFF